jgi:hypothetical protein
MGQKIFTHFYSIFEEHGLNGAYVEALAISFQKIIFGPVKN